MCDSYEALVELLDALARRDGRKPSVSDRRLSKRRSICNLSGYLFSHPNWGNRAPIFASIMAAQSTIIPLFGRQKPYAARLAQTSDYLPMPWAAGDPDLFHGSRVRRRRGRQLDRAGFQGAYLLDLHNVARHPHRFKFNWRRLISEVKSAAPFIFGQWRFPSFCSSQAFSFTESCCAHRPSPVDSER